MPIVGAAQIIVRPVFPGFQSTVGKQMPGFGRQAGKQFAGGFSPEAEKGAIATFGSKAANGLKRSAQVSGAAVGGILAFAIQRGFTRLNAIEQAQAKLRGLGHDAESITTIMTSALASVKGTAFGLDEAATAAASAVAAGIKPGKDLTKYLKITADAATIAGTSFSDMGSIINQVTTAGKAQTDDLNQLADRGIPIYQWLAEQYGVTALELREMVKKGQVDSASFRKAIEENIGGAALSTGDTTQGAFKNLQSSLGRVGANLLSGLFPQLRQGFVSITEALGPVEGKAKVVGTALGGAIGSIAAQFRKHGPDVIGVLKELFASVKSSQAGSIGASLRTIGNNFRDMAPAVVELKSTLPTLPTIISKIADVTGFLAEHSGTLKTVLLGLAAAFVVHKAAMVANDIIGRNSAAGFLLQIGSTIALTISNRKLAASQLALLPPTTAVTAATRRQTAATLLQTIAQRAAGIASTVFSVGLRAVGVAMRFALGPIGLIITAVALLVAGLIYAYRNSEKFRAVVDAAWAGVKKAVAVTWAFLRDTVFPGVVSVFRAIGAGATWLYQNAIKPAFTAASSAFRAVGSVVMSVWKGFLSPVFQLIGAIVVWLAQKIFKVYIGAIVTAFKGLGTAVRFVWTNVLKPTIDALATAGKWLWTNVLKPYFGFIKAGWQALGSLVRERYNRDVKPILEAFGTVAKWVWEKVLAPAWSALKSGWGAVASKISDGYNKTIKPILTYLGDKVGGLKGIFEKAVTAIGTAWDGLKSAARKPIKFVIDVINGLIGLEDGSGGGFNKLAKKFGTDTISQIGYPKGLGFARGGIEPGTSSYRQGDTLVRGFRPGEGVTVSEAMRDPYERARLLALNKAAIRGETAARFRSHWQAEQSGYFLGGILPHPNANPSRHSGYPWARWAGDFGSGYGGTPPIRAWKAGTVAQVQSGTTSYGNRVRINHGKEQTLSAHLSKILVAVGQKVSAGQTIGRGGWSGNVQPRGPAGAHLHWELSGGSGPLGRIGTTFRNIADAVKDKVVDWAGDMKAKLAGPLGTLKQITGTPLGQMAASMPRRLAEAMQDKASGWSSSVAAKAKSAVGAAFGSGRSAARDAMLKLGASSVGTYPGHQPSMNKAWDAMATGATGQRIADHVAAHRKKYGISYVIWNRQMLRDYPKGNIPAGQWGPYFDGNSSNPNRAHTNHVHTSYYAKGTLNARRGLAVIGERQPELVNFRGGEQVGATRKQAEQIFGSGSTGPQEIRGRLDLGNGLEGYLTGIVGSVVDLRDTRSSLRANLTGV